MTILKWSIKKGKYDLFSGTNSNIRRVFLSYLNKSYHEHVTREPLIGSSSNKDQRGRDENRHLFDTTTQCGSMRRNALKSTSGPRRGTKTLSPEPFVGSTSNKDHHDRGENRHLFDITTRRNSTTRNALKSTTKFKFKSSLFVWG